MVWQYIPYSTLVFLAAIISAGLMVWGYRRRPAPGANWFTLLMFAAFSWALCYGMEMHSATLEATLFWSKMQYLGGASLAVAWLALVLTYTGRSTWLTWRHIALLSIIPLISLLLAWTNEWHELLWVDVGLESGNAFNTLKFTPGLWYWVNIAYAYALFVISTLFLIEAYVHSSPLYRSQTIYLLLFSTVTWVGNIAYTFGLTPQHMNMTPVTFSFSGLILAWGLFRYRMLDITPVARDIIMENMGDGVIVLDPNNRVVDLNPAAQEIIGYSLTEVIGKPLAQVLADWPAISQLCERGGEGVRTELALPDADGESRTFDLQVAPLHTKQGRLIGRLILWHDVSEQKRTETEMRLLLALTQDISTAPDLAAALHAALRLIVEHTGWVLGEAWLPNAAGTLLENGQVSYYSIENTESLHRFVQASREYTFASGSGLPGRIWASGQPEWHHDISALSVHEYRRVRHAAAAGLKATFGIPVLTGGEVMAVLVFYMTYPRPEDSRMAGLVSAVAAQLGTVLQHKQAEETIHLQAAALNATANGIVITDRDGTIVWVNPAFTKLTGYAPEEAIGQNPRLLKSGEHTPSFYQRLWDAILSGQTWQGEMINRRRDGSTYVEEQTITPVRNAEGEITNFIAIKQDITNRKQAEEELRKLSRAVEQSGSSIIITDLKGDIEFVNPAFTRVTGYSVQEAVGQNTRILKSGKHPPEMYRELWETIERGEVWRGEFINKKKNGEFYWESAIISPVMDERGKIAHYLAVKEDITDRKLAEEALVQEQRKTDELMRNILPADAVDELKKTGRVLPVLFESASIMFADFANFTATAEQLGPQELVGHLDYYFTAFDRVMEKYGLEKLKTIGDSYMCVSGLPVPSETHAVDIVMAALDMLDLVRLEKERRQHDGRPYWEVRIGISSGPVVAGIVGQKKYAYDVWGDTVVMAARMESSGEVGQVNISRPTFELVREHFDCQYRGKISAKHKGTVEMYFVRGRL